MMELDRLNFGIDNLKICLRIFVVSETQNSLPQLLGNEEYNSDTCSRRNVLNFYISSRQNMVPYEARHEDYWGDPSTPFGERTDLCMLLVVEAVLEKEFRICRAVLCYFGHITKRPLEVLFGKQGM